MKPILVPLDELLPDPQNARRHGENNLLAIEESLREHGQVVPLLARRTDAGLVLVGGHGTASAMRRLGLPKARVVVLEIDEAEARRLSLRLNRTAELATWDETALAEVIAAVRRDGGSTELLGWPAGEVEALLDPLPTAVLGAADERPSQEDRAGSTPWSRVKTNHDTPVLIGDTECFIPRPVYEAWLAERQAEASETGDGIRTVVRRWLEPRMDGTLVEGVECDDEDDGLPEEL